MDNTALYCTMLVCITILVMSFLWLNFKQDEYIANLISDCVYAKTGSEDSVGDCIIEVSRIVKWETANE